MTAAGHPKFIGMTCGECLWSEPTGKFVQLKNQATGETRMGPLVILCHGNGAPFECPNTYWCRNLEPRTLTPLPSPSTS